MACSIKYHAFITLKLTVFCAAFVTTSVSCNDILNSTDICLKYRRLKRAVRERFDHWIPHSSNLAIYSRTPSNCNTTNYTEPRYYRYYTALCSLNGLNNIINNFTEVTDCNMWGRQFKVIGGQRWNSLAILIAQQRHLRSISETYLTYLHTFKNSPCKLSQGNWPICAYWYCHLLADVYFRQSQYSYYLAEPITEPLTNPLDVVCP
jgi:hypothetical protein